MIFFRNSMECNEQVHNVHDDWSEDIIIVIEPSSNSSRKRVLCGARQQLLAKTLNLIEMMKTKREEIENERKKLMPRPPEITPTESVNT